MIFIYEGDLQIAQDESVKSFGKETAVVFDSASEGIAHFKTDTIAKFILITGAPIKEPKVSYGPFVMNTMEEIEEAFNDYHTSQNGFEGADQWESKIKDLMKK